VFLPINVLVLLTTIENHLVENQWERDRTWNSVLVIFFYCYDKITMSKATHKKQVFRAHGLGLESILVGAW